MRCSADPACVFPAVSKTGRCAFHERDAREVEARSMTVVTVNSIYTMGEQRATKWNGQRRAKAKKLTKNQRGETKMSKRRRL